MTSAISVLESSLKTISAYSDPLGLEPIPDDTRQRFLRFKLSGVNGSLLPLQDIAEVKQLTTVDILPVPEIANSVLGVCNWRGEILWLVDLNALIGEPSLWDQAPLLEQPTAIVVQSAQHSIGLVVEHVDDVELIEPGLIDQQTELSSPTLAPYVAGYLPEHKGMVLDVEAIVEHFLQVSS